MFTLFFSTLQKCMISGSPELHMDMAGCSGPGVTPPKRKRGPRGPRWGAVQVSIWQIKTARVEEYLHSWRTGPRPDS